MKKILWFVFECLIAAALIGGAVWYFKYAKPSSAQKGGRKVGVPVVITKTIVTKTVPVSIESLGNTVANESIVLTATTQEIVKDIRFEEGQVVKKGDLLVRLDNELERVALNQAKLVLQDAELNLKEAQIAQKETELKLNEASLRLNEAELDMKEAEREKERLETLYLDNAISEKDFDAQSTQYDRAKIQKESAKAQLESTKTQVDTTKTQVERAKNNVESAKAQVASAETQVADRLVVAPFDGVLGKRKISLGALVSPGTQIATLDDITKIKVDFNVPEKHLADLSRGQKFYATSVAYPDKKFEGTIQLIDTHLNKTTRSVEIRGIMNNVKEKERWLLQPGMLLYLTIELGSAEQIVIPEKAVQSLGEIHYIYIYNPETKKVARREVTTGNRINGNVVLLSGAKDGEIYVDEGISKLADGATVKLAGE